MESEEEEPCRKDDDSVDWETCSDHSRRSAFRLAYWVGNCVD